MISPHGGKLVDRYQPKNVDSIEKYPRVKVGKGTIKDIENIADGVYSPLTGFLREKDLTSVIKDMRLANGMVWPIPIVIDINKKQAGALSNTNKVILEDFNNKLIALLENIEIYKYDKNLFAKNLYSTLDDKHPGVAKVLNQSDYLLGGDIKLLNRQADVFAEYKLTPG